MRHQLIKSYFWPDWNSCVRLGVFHTIFSTKEAIFLGFSPKSQSQFLNCQVLNICRVLYLTNGAQLHFSSAFRFWFQTILQIILASFVPSLKCTVPGTSYLVYSTYIRIQLKTQLQLSTNSLMQLRA